MHLSTLKKWLATKPTKLLNLGRSILLTIKLLILLEKVRVKALELPLSEFAPVNSMLSKLGKFLNTISPVNLLQTYSPIVMFLRLGRFSIMKEVLSLHKLSD